MDTITFLNERHAEVSTSIERIVEEITSKEKTLAFLMVEKERLESCRYVFADKEREEVKVEQYKKNPPYLCWPHQRSRDRRQEIMDVFMQLNRPITSAELGEIFRKRWVNVSHGLLSYHLSVLKYDGKIIYKRRTYYLAEHLVKKEG